MAWTHSHWQQITTGTTAQLAELRLFEAEVVDAMADPRSAGNSGATWSRYEYQQLLDYLHKCEQELTAQIGAETRGCLVQCGGGAY